MRFPHNIFNPFNNADLRWRGSMLFQYLLSFGKTPQLTPKPAADFNYLTLMCRADLVMTRLSLVSLAKNSSALPRLVIAHDESLSREEVRKALAFWPAPFDCFSREAVASYWDTSGRVMLAKFCSGHIFGYKLAACLRLAQSGRVLYADSDVLWFRDAVMLMKECYSLPLYATTDLGHSYNHRILKTLSENLESLLQSPPYLNAGVAVYNRDLLELNQYDEYIREALSEDPVHRFSEQGLVAALAKQIGGVIPNDVICMAENDRNSILASFNGEPWCARHYVSMPHVRQQFWIDAFWTLLV